MQLNIKYNVMLIKFKVKNFRSIKDEVILDLQATSDQDTKEQAVFDSSDVSLLKTLAIYGPNASGKSNIFKALMVFRTMIIESLIRSNLPTPLPNESFKLSSVTDDKPSLFEATFLIDDKVLIYGFEIDKEKVISEYLKQEKGKITFFERKGQEIKSNKNYFKEATAVLKRQTGEKVLFLSLLSTNNGEVSKKILKFIQNINYISGTERGNTLDYSFNQFLDNPKMAKAQKDFIVKADFGISDIEANQEMVSAEDVKNIPDKFKELFFEKNSKIRQRSLKFVHTKFDSKNRETGDEFLDFFSEESEGTQQMFALSAPIIDTLNTGKVLFIDELDASLHPILCQYLITLFNSKDRNPKNAQLIFITHDISILKEDLLRRDQIYFTDKDEQGVTDLFSLYDISERKGLDFAKRYLEGRYNAIPYISDFEDLKFNR